MINLLPRRTHTSQATAMLGRPGGFWVINTYINISLNEIQRELHSLYKSNETNHSRGYYWVACSVVMGTTTLAGHFKCSQFKSFIFRLMRSKHITQHVYKREHVCQFEHKGRFQSSQAGLCINLYGLHTQCCPRNLYASTCNSM